LAEARLQATDDLRFEAPLGNGRFLSQPTMEFSRQANADHPISRPPFRQDNASDNRSYSEADHETSDNGKGDGHGDTPSTEIKRTIMLMATERTAATNKSHNAKKSSAEAGLELFQFDLATALVQKQKFRTENHHDH
jgi:hypothetical protein